MHRPPPSVEWCAEVVTNVNVFSGAFERQLDDKGRLALPSKLRIDLGERVYLTKGFDRSVTVVPEETFRAEASRLAARVVVDRVWSWLFGRGLVPTPDDFGTGGRPPDHPELLDTLACRFMDDGASVKRLVRDIVTSWLPFWTNTRLWVIARPLSGFAETFSQYIVEVNPGGGSDKPEQDKNAEAVLFVVEGEAELTLQGKKHTLKPGGYAFIPPGADWTLHNVSDAAVRFHWIRKHYQVVDGIPLPEAFVTNEQDVEPIPMPGTNGTWVTTRFVDMSDMRHDMHVNIVTFEPGGVIPFAETHVMEHGLYVLEGKAVYRLNQDWVEVEAGDFMWLRAFCPQACYSGGPGRFRYLLYKDVNRHMNLLLNPAR